jgi:hypothetical protein
VTLTEFLRARLVEDEKQAGIDENIGHISRAGYQRAMAEVRAKRALVEDYERLVCYCAEEQSGTMAGQRYQAGITLRILAMPYADHPDYRAAAQQGMWSR